MMLKNYRGQALVRLHMPGHGGGHKLAPELEAIAAARDFPGRHGAILLPWRAALDALP